ncbi:MAG: bifunctional adenosylcobinamide kinase/adenosylcobinamide-phosphate guanylyltransferase [Anaerolineae bacterium]|jgi:adenosylcobinamide kinase/adenosylcobinamide-phosphate guanylyltransferase
MSRELTLLLGGARSGKSRYAEELACPFERALYVAIAQARDGEMAARIAAHRQARPPTWRTVETPTGVGPAIQAALAAAPADAVLLDCVTLWMSNLVLQELGEKATGDFEALADESAAQERARAEIDALLAVFYASHVPWFVVSNEVGWGLVAVYPLGRVYRDLLGWANRRLAAEADAVYLMIAGLPVNVKAGGF